MAEIAVTILLRKLNLFDSFVKEKVQLLEGVRREFEDVRGELQHMQAFLRVADSIEDRHRHGVQIKVWVEQVREAAHDMEDVIDEFMLRLAHHHHGHGFYASIKKISCFVKNLRARHRIASDILGIKIRVKGISKKYQRYKDEKIVEPGSSSSARANIEFIAADEDDLVGIQKPKEKLISWLVEGSTGRDVIPVSGMGGLGKTTLVKQAYEDAEVKKHFKTRVWVTVSGSFEEDLQELLSDMVQQIYSIRKSIPEDVKHMKTNDLMQRIKDLLLESKYLVVLDDVWQIDVWDVIKHALPNNNHGSRVIITTRDAKVASSSSKDTQGGVFTLDPLPEKDSWELFRRKTFQGSPCPGQLESICGSILKRCGGMPLAVVAISGVLATKDVDNIDEWVHVSENLGFEIQESGKLTKVLSLSFNDLPYHLKSCFLYMSIFPEDHLIERMRLVRLWIAEGFVIVNEGNGKSPEEVAEDYLKSLMNRSLIQKANTSSDGRVKTYTIHDLFREMIILKAREQNFAAMAEEDVKWPEKARRLSVINNLGDGKEKRVVPKLRSLLAFYVVNPIIDLSGYGFRLLNVLDLQDTPLEMFPSQVVKLFHLKYLSLRDTKVREIPKSIKKLQNLETLDLKNTFVTELPVEILKLKKLRHLLVYRYEVERYARFNSKFGFKGLAEIGCLESLQKLCFIEANQGCSIIMEEIGKLTQLRRLGIIRFRSEHEKALCSSIQKLSKLRALSVTSAEKNEIIDLNHLSSPPPLLRRMYLRGRMQKLPQWISSLTNLAKLFLTWSQLTEDPLVSIQHLPNLVHLEFQQVYDGKELCFENGGFQKLKVLGIDKFEKLESVSVEKGAMPFLEKLILQRCRKLLKVPSGIEHLYNLKVVDFFDMPNEFIRTLELGKGEDYWKVEHIPEVYSSYLRENGAWEAYGIESFRWIESLARSGADPIEQSREPMGKSVASMHLG